MDTRMSMIAQPATHYEVEVGDQPDQVRDQLERTLKVGSSAGQGDLPANEDRFLSTMAMAVRRS